MTPIVLALGFGLVVGQACHDEDDHHGECRFDPDCGGGIGSFCDHDGECFDGYCCESDNCGGGMCTYRCDRDRDCPNDMGCEHGSCFFYCDDDRDCAPGAKCEHGNTICEWD